jgi:hypothetical protein
MQGAPITCNEKLDYKFCVDHPDSGFPCGMASGRCGAGEDAIAASGTHLITIGCPQGVSSNVYWKYCNYDELIAGRCRLPACPKEAPAAPQCL